MLIIAQTIMNVFLLKKRKSKNHKKSINPRLRQLTFGSVFALLLLMSGGVFGQIINEDFRGGSLPSGWAQTSVTFTTSASGYANFTASASKLTSPAFDASAFASIDIAFDCAKFGSGTDGPLTLEYSLNGGTDWTVSGNSNTPTSSTYVSSSFNISTLSNNMKIRINRSSSASQKRFRDLIITGVAPSGFTVTYNGNFNTGGSEPSDVTAYASGATVTVLGNTGSLTKTSYNFTGWNTLANGTGTDRVVASTFSMPAANTTLYAKWTGNVSYDANGGTGTVTDATDYLEGASVSTASGAGFTRASYTLIGWNTLASGTGTSYSLNQVGAFTFAGNTTLYAVWNPVGSKTVIFEANGGTGTMANQTESSATNLTSNSFTRTGYTFANWNTVSDGSGTTYTDGQSYDFAANITLYAQWTANNNTITFNGNGSTSGTMADQTIATDATAALTSNSFVRTGYTFASWNTLADGSGTTYANGASYTMGTANVTLYARWAANNNTVTFDGNGSTAGTMSNQTIATAATAALTTNAYTRTGYTFASWNTLADGSGTTYADGASYTMGTSSVTLYAQWDVYVGPCLSDNFNSNYGNWTGGSGTYNSSGAGETGNGVGFNTNNDDIITSSATSNAKSITFRGSASSGGANYTMTIQTSTSSSGPWTSEGTIAANGSNTGSITTSWNTYTISFAAIGNYYIRFLQSPRSGGSFYLDNVDVYCGIPCTPQTITAITPATLTKATTDPTYSVATTADSGLIVSYESSNTAVATVDASGTVSLVGVGTTTITASQAGDGTYCAATAVTQVLTVVAVPVVTGASLTGTVGTAFTHTIAATNSPTSYTVTGTLPPGLTRTTNVISGTPTAAGSYSVTITGTNAAGTSAAATFDFIISKGTQTITFADVNKTYGDASFTLNATATSGLTVTYSSSNSSVATISGNTVTLVGVGISTITASQVGNADWNASVANDKVLTVSAKALSISGLSVANKVYDGTTTAMLSGTAALVGVVNSDDVSLSAPSAVAFDTKNVGTGKAITVTYTLSGTKAGNYTLTQPSLTANITKKGLTVTGATAQNKPYDGTTTAVITGSTLVGIISPDIVTVSGGGTFANANVGTGKAVTAALALAGAGAGNYSVTQPSGLTANISAVGPTFTTSAITISAGGTYTLPGTAVSSTSAGTITYSLTSGGFATLSSGTLTGVAAGSETLTVNQAANGNYLAGSTTVTVNVVTVVYVVGDFRTTYDGTGLSYSTGWEYYNGSAWVAVPDGKGPESTATSISTVYIDHQVDGGGNATKIYNCNFVVRSGGNLTLNDLEIIPSTFVAASRRLEVLAGGILTINGDLGVSSSGDLIVRSGGNMIIDSPNATNDHPMWSGNENFESGSTVTINDWKWAASATARSLVNTTVAIKNNTGGYKFGNLIIDVNPTGSFVLIGGGIGVLKLCENDLDISNASANYIHGASNASLAGFEIGGNMSIYDGPFSFGANFSSGSNTYNHQFIINGNFECQSNDAIKINSLQNGTNTLNGNVTFKGNVTIGSSVASFTNESNTSSRMNVFLEGGTELSPASISIAPTAVAVPFTINNGYRKLQDQNVSVNSASGYTSPFIVKSGATLDFGFGSTGTPLNIVTSAGAVGTNSFTTEAGSTLKITSADGITTSGATGNVQSSTRSFGVADYHYVGTANQTTGNGLPATVANLIIKNTGTAPANEVLLTNNTTANTKVNILTGVLNLNEKTASGASLDIANDATLKIVGTATFPSFTTKTFEANSIVEYGGTDQVIAALTAPTYAKLQVSGTGTKTLATADVEVGNTLEVTSSLLSIEQDKTLTVTNGITTENDAISVANGGSLVQVTDVDNASANNNTGKIGVARITQPMYKFDYTYWSAPVGGTTLHDLSPDTPANRYFSWNPTAVSPSPNWSVITAGAGTMNAGTGYIIRAPNSYAADATAPASYQTYNGSFSGVPNNGTVSTSVSGSDTVDIWNLLGNPYPSAIDASAFLDANVGGTNDILGGTLYFWTHNTPYGVGTTYAYTAADYATWNGTGETATTDDTVLNNDNSPSGKIAAGQAFFVRGTANGTAVFKNTMREKGQNMQFFRGATTAETTTTVEKNRVWLNLKGANNAFSQTLVGYVTNATNDYDVRYDGESFGGNFVTFYSVNNGKNLVSQGRALPFVTTDEVPLGYKATGTGNLTIAIDHTDGALATQAIYLKDNVLNVVHDLTAGAYTFAAVAGTFNNRFVLRYLPAENLGNPTFDDAMNGVTIRKNDATLRINSPYETIDAVMVYDIMGRLVFEQKDCNATTFEASNIVYSEQTLIVKVRLSNGGVVTKKVL